MNSPNSSTDAGKSREGVDPRTDPALSSHTFTGSADRVALRVTPARGDAPTGSVEVIDAASQPVGTTPPQPEIVVRQLNPDTHVPAPPVRSTPSHTPPPVPFPPVHTQVVKRGGNRTLGRRAWFGIAAIIVALLAIGFFALQTFGRTSSAVSPTANVPATVSVSATLVASPVPTLAPLPTPVPIAIPATSIPSAPTVVPSPTAVPTATVAPTVVSTAAPIVIPTAVPPTSVPSASSPPPTDVPAATPQQGTTSGPPAAPLPALPPLPPAIQFPPTSIPTVPQIPRRLPGR